MSTEGVVQDGYWLPYIIYLHVLWIVPIGLVVIKYIWNRYKTMAELKKFIDKREGR